MIMNSMALTGLEGLESLQSIGVGCDLESDFMLQNIHGFSALESIGGELKIMQCNSLHSLSGLDSLETIGGMLWLEENNALESLSGIDSLNSEELDGIKIIYNPQLSECDVESICDFLAGSNENITVYVNGPGCNNSGEIEYECFVSADGPAKEDEILIFYNAAQHLLQVTNPEEEVQKIMIYNMMGHLVLENRNSETLNLSILSDGIYLAIVTTTKDEYRYKFIY